MYNRAMEVKFYSHGACQEVTGSRHFLAVGGETLQIDCGMFQGRREEAYRKNEKLPFKPADVSAMLLTHAHFDHCGALPLMVKNGFDGNVFCTSATRDVAEIVLQDSAHIQEKDYEFVLEKRKKHPERGLEAFPPLYDAEDVVKALETLATFNYHRPFFPLAGVKAEFFDAGHIIGSAMVRLTVGDLRIGFSGDLGRRGLPIIKDPESFADLDYLVLEGTYGNRLHKSIGMAREELREIIVKAHSRNGKIIIPAFSIERTQELIYLIHLLHEDRQIPDIPIYIDSPMAVNATAIFKVHPECFDGETAARFTNSHIDPFGWDNIHYVNSVRESMEINKLKTPAVIISASGMAESGRIVHHLANNIENPKNIVAVVGFMAEHTLGRKLVERQPEIRIFGKTYRVQAEIATLNAFSGHADYEETKQWLESWNWRQLKKIFLVHGEPEALANLKRELEGMGVPQVEIVQSGRVYPLS